jgi:hypothetical protein
LSLVGLYHFSWFLFLESIDAPQSPKSKAIFVLYKTNMKIQRIDERPAPFSPEVRAEHLLHKISMWRHMRSTPLLIVLTSPLIYVCVVPFLMLDLAVAVYQAICFPIYRIPKVTRRDYLVYDRGHLAYLNVIEKVACLYCSYANGLLAYIAEIAARTQQHFCPIKHARRNMQSHSRDAYLLPYGDARVYRAKSNAVAQDFSDLIQITTK